MRDAVFSAFCHVTKMTITQKTSYVTMRDAVFCAFCHVTKMTITQKTSYVTMRDAVFCAFCHVTKMTITQKTSYVTMSDTVFCNLSQRKTYHTKKRRMSQCEMRYSAPSACNENNNDTKNDNTKNLVCH